jgi:hypothetical protein
VYIDALASLTDAEIAARINGLVEDPLLAGNLAAAQKLLGRFGGAAAFAGTLAGD